MKKTVTITLTHETDTNVDLISAAIRLIENVCKGSHIEVKVGDIEVDYGGVQDDCPTCRIDLTDLRKENEEA